MHTGRSRAALVIVLIASNPMSVTADIWPIRWRSNRSEASDTSNRQSAMTVSSLIRQLDSDELVQRLTAAVQLAAKGRAAQVAKPRLITLLWSSDDEIHRVIYAQAVVMVSGESVGFTALIEALENGSPRTRQLATAATVDILKLYAELPSEDVTRQAALLERLVKALPHIPAQLMPIAESPAASPIVQTKSAQVAPQSVAQAQVTTAGTQSVAVASDVPLWELDSTRPDGSSRGRFESLADVRIEDSQPRSSVRTIVAQQAPPAPLLVPPGPKGEPPEELNPEGPVGPERVPLTAKFKTMEQLGVHTLPVAGDDPPNFAQPVFEVNWPRQLPNGNELEWELYVRATQQHAHRHQPLYFEDSKLERCGDAHGSLQPIVSAAKFATATALLPYQVGVEPWHKTVTTHPEQFTEPRPPFKKRAAVLQAATTVGLILLIP